MVLAGKNLTLGIPVGKATLKMGEHSFELSMFGDLCDKIIQVQAATAAGKL